MPYPVITGYGISFISTGDEASAFARFHFRPHFFQHSGFRVVRMEPGRIDAMSYESQEMLNKYMLMHWAAEEEIVDSALAVQLDMSQLQHLPIRCAELVVRYTHGFDQALDLGCAVGRSTFELTRSFSHVDGVNYSHEFIAAANALRQHGELGYSRKNQGSENTRLLARVDKDIDRARARFMQGDACALPETLHGYDAVLLANVLCRLSDPAKCLARMQQGKALVKPGGILVMTTPLSWLEEYTPQSKWLKSVADIKTILTEFELLHTEEIPFRIREHRRKFEYIVTQATVWKRRI